MAELGKFKLSQLQSSDITNNSQLWRRKFITQVSSCNTMTNNHEEVKVHLNVQYPGSETSVGSSPTPINILFAFFSYWKFIFTFAKLGLGILA